MSATNTKIIRTMVVDDHKLVRKGLMSLLREEDDIQIVAEASDGEEAVQLAKTAKPHIILMDLQMPGMGGLEATKKIIRHNPDIKIIVLTVCDSELFPARLLEEGASGYITKDCGIDEIVHAVRSVNNGNRYISPDVAQKLALRRFTKIDKDSPFDCLSERELQVMLMITSGDKPQDIADKLHLSTKTVNTYRYRIFEKLGVKSDVELTRLALRYEIIDNE